MTATATRTVVSEQDAVKLAAVYLFTLRNWAVYAEEIAEAINAEKDKRFKNTDVKEINRLLRRLERAQLVVGDRVNSERKLTWQTYFDIQNEDDAEQNAEAAFIAAFEPRKNAKATATGRTGATGPRYTDAQISAGLKARAEGLTNKAVAAAAGVKSPSYFSKTLKAVEAGHVRPALSK